MKERIERLQALKEALALAEREYMCADYIDSFDRRQRERARYAADIQYYKTAIESLEQEIEKEKAP